MMYARKTPNSKNPKLTHQPILLCILPAQFLQLTGKQGPWIILSLGRGHMQSFDSDHGGPLPGKNHVASGCPFLSLPPATNMPPIGTTIN